MRVTGAEGAPARRAPGPDGLPRPQRHRTVIATLEALVQGMPLVVVNDHEPNALQPQLERRYGPRLGWDVRERSGDRVGVTIWLSEPHEPDLVASADGVLRNGRFPTAA